MMKTKLTANEIKKEFMVNGDIKKATKELVVLFLTNDEVMGRYNDFKHKQSGKKAYYRLPLVGCEDGTYSIYKLDMIDIVIDILGFGNDLDKRGVVCQALNELKFRGVVSEKNVKSRDGMKPSQKETIMKIVKGGC